MKKQKIILYTSKSCTRCRSLKKWLRRNKISFVEKDLEDTDIMTSLVMRDVAVFSAPILETKDRFWLSREIFGEDNSLDPDFIKNFGRRKK